MLLSISEAANRLSIPSRAVAYALRKNLVPSVRVEGYRKVHTDDLPKLKRVVQPKPQPAPWLPTFFYQSKDAPVGIGENNAR